MSPATTTASKPFRCTYCRNQVSAGDEIGFGIIKNKNREPAERTVPICLPCWEREALQQYGGYQEDP